MRFPTRALPLALLLALPCALAAPPPGGPGPGAGAHQRDSMRGRDMDPAAATARMTEHLGLSPEQSKSVGEINQRLADGMEAERKRFEEARNSYTEAKRRLIAEREQALKKVLNEEQYREHQAAKRGGQPRQDGPHVPRPPGSLPGATGQAPETPAT